MDYTIKVRRSEHDRHDQWLQLCTNVACYYVFMRALRREDGVARCLEVMKHFFDVNGQATYRYIPQPGDLFLSDLHAMQSAAGWYLGHACLEYVVYRDEDPSWLWQPWDRVSCYYDNRIEAELALDAGTWIPSLSSFSG